jgi:DNA-binding MarR family transcriptional regulator
MTKRLAHDEDVASLMGFQLQMANLRFDEAARAALEDHAISPAKVTALSFVSANPGCEQSALARALSINRASAMKLVNILAERGLVERRPGRDLRSNALHLTPHGAAELPRMIARLRESEQGVLTALTDRERAQLLRLLTKVHDARSPEKV